MRAIHILAVLCAVVPTIAVAKDAPAKVEPVPAARKMPVPTNFVAPGILRQDLFDRNNPNNLRHDYPAAPAQPGQF
jgi:hypothetical protein